MKRFPLIALVLGILYIASGFRVPNATSFDLNGFGKLPILNGGRIKPIDTLARTSLLLLSGKQTLRYEGKRLSAVEWLTQTLFNPSDSQKYPVFEIDDPDVLGALRIEQTKRRFSYEELQNNLQEIERLALQAEPIKPEQRSRFETAVTQLQGRVTLYHKLQLSLQYPMGKTATDSLIQFEKQLSSPVRQKLKDPNQLTRLPEVLMQTFRQLRFLDNASAFYPFPVEFQHGGATEWVSIGRAMVSRLYSNSYHPGLIAFASLGDSWRDQQSAGFNSALDAYRAWLSTNVPNQKLHAEFEYLFNHVSPFYRSLVLYLCVFMAVLGFWLTGKKPFNQAAYYLLILAFVVHTAGLISRMLIQGRPPVTNLYSSAIFVGWVAVLLGIGLERLHKRGIGSLTAAVIGFITLIIAHHLSTSGDTLEMMRAVLDSNFWLATHVVTITIGYGSTFLAGVLAIVYIARQAFDRAWTLELGQTFERMVYGVVCFSCLLSFVGTVLGGIWADQSWGRFWGWDPKENGALLIVLWNVFILHARWGGYARRISLMRLALIGNIVTAFSWFGVNMLGIGLHSYGFMDKAFVWLVLFTISQFLILALTYKTFKRTSISS